MRDMREIMKILEEAIRFQNELGADMISDKSETECKTPGAIYQTNVSGNSLSVKVQLPAELTMPDMSERDAEKYEDQMHGALEEIVSGIFDDFGMSDQWAKADRVTEMRELLDLLEAQATPTSPEQFFEIAGGLVEFAISELGLDKFPQVRLMANGNMESSFGQFDSSNDSIKVEIMNRHPVDILRTIAHELTHYRQGVLGQLHSASGETGSDQENEANSMAGIIMRKFGKMNPHLFKLGAVG